MDSEISEDHIRSAATRDLKEGIALLEKQCSTFRSMESIAVRSMADAATEYAKKAKVLDVVIDRMRRELSRRERLILHGSVGWPLLVSLFAVMIGGAMRMPYAYYQFMRGGLCVMLIWLSLQAGRTAWLILALPLAVLYNPIYPVILGSKDLWTTINEITLVAIGALLYVANKKKVDAAARDSLT